MTLHRLLAAADLDLRVRLESYDDHDDVLGARAAARTDAQHDTAEARHDANVQAFGAATAVRPEASADAVALATTASEHPS